MLNAPVFHRLSTHEYPPAVGEMDSIFISSFADESLDVTRLRKRLKRRIHTKLCRQQQDAVGPLNIRPILISPSHHWEESLELRFVEQGYL